MGKNPAFQFYPNDWARDLEEHPLEVEGAWIRICCKLWWSDTRGQLSKSVIQWARILRVSEDKTLELLGYIKNEKIGNIPTDLANCNGNVTVESRRMVKDEKERELTRLRVEKYRREKARNAPVTPMKQPSSSSSPSSVHKKSTKEQYSSSEPSILKIPLVTKNKNTKEPFMFDITQKDIDEWQDTYPAVQILQILKIIKQWNLDNPNRRKTKGGIRTHISKWLAREQDKGRFEDKPPEMTPEQLEKWGRWEK